MAAKTQQQLNALFGRRYGSFAGKTQPVTIPLALPTCLRMQCTSPGALTLQVTQPGALTMQT